MRSLTVLLAIGILVLGTAACDSSESATTSEAAQTTVTSAAVVGTTTTVAVPTTVAERDYPGKDKWFVELPGQPNAYSIVGVNGSEGFDMASFVNSVMAEKLIALQYNTLVLYTDDMDPALVAFWDGLGIKKELHDAEDKNKAWASYTPVAALEPGNTTKYPVVFSFHGNKNTILHAEGFGFANLGATAGLHHRHSRLQQQRRTDRGGGDPGDPRHSRSGRLSHRQKPRVSHRHVKRRHLQRSSGPRSPRCGDRDRDPWFGLCAEHATRGGGRSPAISGGDRHPADGL